MNIVKLKDILMPETSIMGEFFNKNLKGKYAYWVQMRYIFPLESLNYRTYIKYEQYDSIQFLDENILPHIDLYSEECCMIDFVNMYVDIEETEKINSSVTYAIYNNHTSDFDIDINMLKVFRTWLATELLKFNTDTCGCYIGKYSEDVIHMLEFYRGNMYNDVIKQLSIFGKQEYIVNTTGSSCGCCNSNISSLYNVDSINMCDTISIYKDNIHKLMVKTFESLDFWKQFDIDFIRVFKKYIDNILKNNMIIRKKTGNILNTCNCNTENSDDNNILNRLSTALNYIITNSEAGHINYIHDALHDWAEYLYDNMYWVNK